jgi:enamine deaminase RidA (YjgF/YER057c/UK114 family)
MKRENINPPTLHAPHGYSHVTVVTGGRQVHVAGQVAFDAAGRIVGKGDLQAQTEQVYVNLAHALAAAGAKLSDVYRLVTYVVGHSPDKVGIIRAVRARHLGDGPYPASTMVGVTTLNHPDALIEIEVSAAIE